MQDRIDNGNTIDKQEVELATFNAKHTLNEEQNNIARFKKALPEDLRGMKHNLLMTAMAYNNGQADFNAFCRSEMRQSSVFLDGMAEPLKKLKSDFNRSSPPHPYASVHRYDNKDLLVSLWSEWSDLLFDCQISHFDPSLSLFVLACNALVVQRSLSHASAFARFQL